MKLKTEKHEKRLLTISYVIGVIVDILQTYCCLNYLWSAHEKVFVTGVQNCGIPFPQLFEVRKVSRNLRLRMKHISVARYTCIRIHMTCTISFDSGNRLSLVHESNLKQQVNPNTTMVRNKNMKKKKKKKRR